MGRMLTILLILLSSSTFAKAKVELPDTIFYENDSVINTQQPSIQTIYPYYYPQQLILNGDVAAYFDIECSRKLTASELHSYISDPKFRNQFRICRLIEFTRKIKD